MTESSARVFIPRALVRLGRLAVALVWLWQGLWLKVIRPDPRHTAVAASALGLAEGPATADAWAGMDRSMLWGSIRVERVSNGEPIPCSTS